MSQAIFFEGRWDFFEGGLAKHQTFYVIFLWNLPLKKKDVPHTNNIRKALVLCVGVGTPVKENILSKLAKVSPIKYNTKLVSISNKFHCSNKIYIQNTHLSTPKK